MNLLPKDSPVQRNCTDIWRIFARYSSSVHLLNNNGTAGEEREGLLKDQQLCSNGRALM